MQNWTPERREEQFVLVRYANTHLSFHHYRYTYRRHDLTAWHTPAGSTGGEAEQKGCFFGGCSDALGARMITRHLEDVLLVSGARLWFDLPHSEPKPKERGSLGRKKGAQNKAIALTADALHSLSCMRDARIGRVHLHC